MNIKKLINSKKRILFTPTEKELYNLIINIYLTKIMLNISIYLTNNFLSYAIDHIERITKQLKNKLDNKSYNFSIETLTKYIDKSIKCENIKQWNNESPQSDFYEIANYNNLTYGDLLQDPLTYFNTILDNIIKLEHTPSKTIKRYIKEFMQNDFLICATDTPINRLNQFTIYLQRNGNEKNCCKSKVKTLQKI